MEAEEYRLLFESMPGACLVLHPQFTIHAVNDAYLAATMTEREAIVGRHVFDVFPDDPADAKADGVGQLRASLHHVLREQRPHGLAAQRYPIRNPAVADGAFEERYWSVLNTPVIRGGEVAFILHTVEDVTKLVNLQREKLEVDQRLDAVSARSDRLVELLDGAPDAIVVSSDCGLIQLVNRQTEQMFGYARDELLGQRLEVLVPERFRGRHVEHIGRFFAAPSARPMGGRGDLELYGRRKDGSELPIEVSLSPYRRGDEVMVSAAIRDVSERKRFEVAARLNAQRLVSAVDSMQDAIALFDAEDRLVLCNSAYRRLLHASAPGSLVGRLFADLLDTWTHDMVFDSEEERVRWRDERLARRRREHATVFDVHLRDGRRMRVVDRHTAEGGIVKTIWDLTDEVRLADELREARAAAEAASEAKSEFLASMSHELRTPLNAILGFAQLLLRDRHEPLPERHRQRVDHVVTGGEHLLRLIDDILDLARIEAGQVSVSLEPVEVDAVLDEVMKTLEPLAGRAQVELRLEADVEVTPRVIADRTRLAQILMNLGSNGVKYNRPSGRVVFHLLQLEHGQLRIKVSDTGIGVPYDKQSKLFEPFQRAGQENGPIEGTGIGLVITRRLARLMNGEIGFESVPGEGSVFWLDLPLEQASDTKLSSTPRAHVAGSAFERPSGSTATVLYVEDNRANVAFMRDLMSSFEGIDLINAASAETGLEIARTRQPTLIIMDINLPGMSGIDALRALRAIPETKSIPVIALTAAATERDRRMGLQAGFARYLTKPIHLDELMTALEQLLPGS